MVDGTFALDGGAEFRRWKKRHGKIGNRAARNKARLKAYDERCARFDKEQRRQRRVASVETVERAAFLKARKSQGYLSGRRYKDMEGQRFGLLVVVRPGGHLKSGSKRWWVQCDCGSPEKQISGTNLKQGLLRSCGFYCTAHPREQWHKPHITKRWAARRKALEALRTLPVSLKLLQYYRGNSHNREDAALLRKVRSLVIWAEIAQGLVWSRDGRRPAYTSGNRELVPKGRRRQHHAGV